MMFRNVCLPYDDKRNLHEVIKRGNPFATRVFSAWFVLLNTPWNSDVSKTSLSSPKNCVEQLKITLVVTNLEPKTGHTELSTIVYIDRSQLDVVHGVRILRS